MPEIPSPHDQHDLDQFLKDEPGVPEWFNKPESPLVFDVFFVDQSTEHGEKFVFYVGNSGLVMTYDNSVPHLQMEFKPNAEFSEHRDDRTEAMRNSYMWAAAFNSFLEWYKEQSQTVLGQYKTIRGETNESMFKVRMKLLASLDPEAMREDTEGREEVDDIDAFLHGDSTHFVIDIEKVTQSLEQPDSAHSLFIRAVRRIARYQHENQMVNPRLVLLKRDQATGNKQYGFPKVGDT